MSESPAALSMKRWLKRHGGGFHDKALYAQDASGSRIVAGDFIPADTTIVSCPFDLVITEALAKKNVLEILGDALHESTSGWCERQWISTYLALHWIIEPQDSRFDVSGKLLHRIYVDTLPKPETLRTSLHFTPSELNLFEGTNLYGATIDRENEWQAEWEQCRDACAQRDPYLGEQFTWERYLNAATYLTSRAFPSSLLSPTPTLAHSPTTKPVLIPGVDALNHSRGQPITWYVAYPDDKKAAGTDKQQPTISLIIHSPTEAGKELFNNYGPKPNAELILGYGFSMDENPDDTIVLKINGLGRHKWEVGRNAWGAEGLWMEILSIIIGPAGQVPGCESLLNGSGQLCDIVEGVIERLPSGLVPNSEDFRPDVVKMFHEYLEGQHDILDSLLTFFQERESEAIALARKQGIDLDLDEESLHCALGETVHE